MKNILYFIFNLCLSTIMTTLPLSFFDPKDATAIVFLSCVLLVNVYMFYKGKLAKFLKLNVLLFISMGLTIPILMSEYLFKMPTLRIINKLFRLDGEGAYDGVVFELWLQWWIISIVIVLGTMVSLKKLKHKLIE